MRTQYQVIIDTKIRNNPKLDENEDGQLKLKTYLKTKMHKSIQKPETDIVPAVNKDPRLKMIKANIVVIAEVLMKKQTKLKFHQNISD